MNRLYKVLIVISFLFLLSGCNISTSNNEGRYLVNQINADRNRYKNEKLYFYASKLDIYCYSLKSSEKKNCVHLEETQNYTIDDFAVYDDMIYYVISNGNGT